MKRFFACILGFTLFGYGLIAFLVQDPELSRVVTIPYRAFILIFSILLYLYPYVKKIFVSFSKNDRIYKLRVKTKIESFIFNKIWMKLISLFVLAYSFRLVYDIFVQNTPLWKDKNEYILFWFFISIIPGLNFFKIRFQDAETILYSSWVILLISSILGLNLVLFNSGSFAITGRLAAAAINPISLGQAGVSLSLLSLLMWLRRKELVFDKWRKFRKLIDYILLTTSGIGLLLCLFAASRGPIVSAVVGFLALILLNKKDLKLIFLLFTVVLASLFALNFATNQGSGIIERLSNPLVDYSDDYNVNYVSRGQLFSDALNLFITHPLLGAGIEVPSLGYPHNLILESCLATGLFGGLIFSACYFLALIKSIYLIASSHCHVQWFGLIYIQYAIGVMFSGAIYSSSGFWYFMFAVIGLRFTEAQAKTTSTISQV